MTPFLRQIARHYIDERDLCMVFPNRRSQVFFIKYLSEEVKSVGKPALAPQCFTIDEFVYHIAGARKTDKVLLLLRLYECYSELYSEKNRRPAEPLDDFVFWGDIILKDFSDIDRYNVNASHIFRNVSDYKKLSDDFTYLTDRQKEAMTLFLDRINLEKEMDSNFQKVWDLLDPLYERFRKRLEDEGMAYDGMVYRKAAEEMDNLPECSKFVFVGLNALDECERLILKKLKNSGKAEFCWDFSSPMVCDDGNKASLFIRDSKLAFGQDIEIDPDGLPRPEIIVAGVASSVAQAKYLYSILEQLPAEARNERTAVVLPDEAMLVPVMNSIPESITKVNISMGLPMRNSEIFALMSEIARLQLHISEKGGTAYFHYRQVYALFLNGIFRNAAGEEAVEIMETVRKAKKYYIPQSDFAGNAFFELVFRKADDIGAYLTGIIIALAPSLKASGTSLELDFARRFHEAVSRLEECGLPEIKPATYFRLLNQLLILDSVPFKGEPLRGLQIMGPLETRAVDFDNVIILSCNEGLFPKHPVSSSFIPGELRCAFGLPTYEHHDAMNSYYFYRLIQRAQKVWMVYDSRMQNMRAGEESRYIKQLEMLYPQYVTLSRVATKAEWRHIDEIAAFPKTDDDMQKIHSTWISPSAMKAYRACPAMFYFNVVKGLKIEDNLEENLDSRTMGTVFHSVMESIYKKEDKVVTREWLKSVLDDVPALERRIEEKIMEEMHSILIEGRNLVYRNLVREYVVKTLERDIEYLDRRGAKSFKILKLEEFGEAEFNGLKFHGILDRMDSVVDGEVRVVDYKTGSIDQNAMSDINLQIAMYNMFIRNDRTFQGFNILNSIYSPANFFIEAVRDIPENDSGVARQAEKFVALVAEILDPDIPFAKKPREDNCKYCDFKAICRK